MNTPLRPLVTALLLLLLSGCLKTELGGSVAGSAVSVTDLRSGEIVQDGLSSRTLADFIDSRSQEKWDKLGDLGRMINLGNFSIDSENITAGRWYLVTASAGEDMDADGDGVVDPSFAPVSGFWHALLTGRQLIDGGYAVSPLTEAVYRSVKADIPQLTDAELGARLDTAARATVNDVNDDGTINYRDAAGWSTLFHREAYLHDFQLLNNLAGAIRAGADEQTLQTLSISVLGNPTPDARQFFDDNISMPIVQSKCVNCHTSGGLAPNSGARLIVVTNSNPDHLQINHQAFITLRERLGSRDLSDYVTQKVSAQISHGGGRQIRRGSQDLENLETYLNLIE